jgi:hypothetical protein
MKKWWNRLLKGKGFFWIIPTGGKGFKFNFTWRF